MYRPAAFREDDPAVLREIIDAHPFATLVTVTGGAPFATPLPFVRDGDALLGHVARANPQWRHFGAAEALVVFSGPHAYVSPRWYASADNVPTWNYVAVHVYGVPEIIPAGPVVRAMAARFDPEWRMDGAFAESLLPAIVGIRIPMTRVEGKLKLSQNRDRPDAEGARAALAEGDPEARAVAAWMGRWMSAGGATRSSS
jgi:transcriptional regulator